MTQIVIPKAIYPSHLEQQNIFQPSITPEDLRSNPIYSQKTLSKKPAGAFKLFKLKKLRKTEAESTNSQPPVHADEPQPHRSYKLKTRSIAVLKEETITQFSSTSQPPFGYFDPNTAPLYSQDSNIVLLLPEFREAFSQKKGLFLLENQQKIIVQKTSPKNIQIIESESDISPQFYYQRQQCQPNDSFIIIKKVSVKKAKLKKAMGNSLNASKLSRKSKENELLSMKISKITQLNELKYKEAETPSVKSRDELLLPDTEKSEHSKMEEMIEEASEAKYRDKKSIKRSKQIGDYPDFSQYHFYSDNQPALARSLFDGIDKSTVTSYIHRSP